jgi:hypothetical protein
MTQKEFKKVLDDKEYSYKIEGDKIIITKEWGVFLNDIDSLPSGVVFMNDGDVHLVNVQVLQSHVYFDNGGEVHLDSLYRIPPDVKFRNRGYIWFSSIRSISPGVEFMSNNHVNLQPLIDGVIDDWEGNIDDIEPRRLFNKMISLGLFDRNK